VSTIVVASDAPSVRAEVSSALGEPGAELIEVHTGHDVASAVDEHEPDLVVVDMQMGNMGAMAVCMDLRLEASYGNLPHVPVLMLLDRRADVFLARRSGAEGWLVKPLDPLRLRKAAAALCEGGTYHDRSFEPVPSVIEPVPPVIEPVPPVIEPVPPVIEPGADPGKASAAGIATGAPPSGT
jgi:DNA-binding response OmpR family regulator